MQRILPLAAVLALIFVSGCATRATIQEAAIDVAQRDATIDCDGPDACAVASPIAPLVAAAAGSTEAAPVHYVNLLEHVEASLALRLHLMRSAKRSIDIQTFIWSEDDTGHVTLAELIAAARRGVKVRVLVDQLYSLDNPRRLAELARAHANLEIRMYNPTFGDAKTQPLEFAAGLLCCFFRVNQRMHNKLLVIDDEIGINGGRNIDDRYFDMSDTFNYRDRDVLVIGPAVAEMASSFDAYWQDEIVVPVERLKDVALRIAGDEPGESEAPKITDPGQVERVLELADDDAFLTANYVDKSYRVGRVEYFADRPGKVARGRDPHDIDLSGKIQDLIRGARERIVLQTPYLVFSDDARKLFKQLRRAQPQLKIVVSTNSLASTDAFYVYAISHRFKREYLRELGLEIYEYKPFAGRGEPGEPDELAPQPAGTASARGSGGDHRVALFGKAGRRDRRAPPPLLKPGIRRGMHSKSFAIDGRIAMIGSHNFDPRSSRLNTESGVIVWDAAFTQALEQVIAADIAPDQSWTIARKRKVPVVSGVKESIEVVSDTVPVVDFWPFRYATSYELKPGCSPLPPNDPGFGACYAPVGDFPEVDLSLKQVYTLIIAAFGQILVPIM
ncbi:MAG TPA: phospholipase D family protein [Candidatus Saccharimonadia bacterium]|nr:phospholipase D family protein [Candidatus Saccharimonadia bacterium]